MYYALNKNNILYYIIVSIYEKCFCLLEYRVKYVRFFLYILNGLLFRFYPVIILC